MSKSSSKGVQFAAMLTCALAGSAFAQDGAVAALPSGVTAVWDLGQAHCETTPTREKVCINGLWLWQPADGEAGAPPTTQWGYFKVPGSWPGITDYMQKDAQTVVPHASWKERRMRELGAAWYEREFVIPREWAGRRIVLAASQVNSLAEVWVDGARCGEIRFPGGELDLTAASRPGALQRLSLRVVALPLKEVLLSYADSNTAREVKGRVARRGLCGDVYLVGLPAGPRIADVRVDTSHRRKTITFDVALEALASDARYTVEARISRDRRPVREFTSRVFTREECAAGRLAFSAEWDPGTRWDLHTPEEQYEVTCVLTPEGRAAADVVFSRRFGFREFWIEGRDFFLNGSRLQLSVVPLDNAQVSAGLASYAGARESLERLKGIGINFVYTHNYGCEPGAHLAFDEILRAADDVGMLVGFSQPHFSHYDWKAPDAAQRNGYARHAEYYVRVAQNHPAVVAYAMNHNATGYTGDMNPDWIDGRTDPREARAQVNAQRALQVEAIVRGYDPSRVIYHHSSGNLGSMHTINFYPNFVPVQELSDWFEHWATTGVKPVFLCEYGAPFSWDWTMYRGWYKGVREFGSAAVPWQFSLAEWNAQFLGDAGFLISTREAQNLRWEAKQLAAGKVWHRWDYPHQVGSSEFDERHPVFALYLADNWPAFRTWGLSAISPWEFGHYWKPREGVDRRRQDLKVDWAGLQRPGFSADYVEGRYERMDLAFGRDDWVATDAARALLRFNRPLLAYLAGKPTAFTSKDHVFTPGETIEKQLIVINNSRVTVTGEAQWVWAFPSGGREGRQRIVLEPGRQERIPLRWEAPRTEAPGACELQATVQFDTGETQRDSLRLQVRPATRHPAVEGRVALFDPRGETAALLRRRGVRFLEVTAAADLTGIDLLVVGKLALGLDSPAPDIAGVREGLKVLLFEQSAEVLERRFGFRVTEYGLRRVFPRVPDHPVLAGIEAEQLRDWRGEATVLPPRLASDLKGRQGPTVQWCGLPVPRLWRAGNRGNVASVLIEKPARGDFLPIVDGGFSLQYSPLLEYREGRGVVVFCQLDVTGRTEIDPVGEQLAGNVLAYVAQWQPALVRVAVYAGDPAGGAHLTVAGFTVAPYRAGELPDGSVLVVGPDAGRRAEIRKADVERLLQTGGRVVAFGLEQADLDAVLPRRVTLASREHIATTFAPGAFSTWSAGIGPADVHNRDPRQLPLVTAGAEGLGNGVLAAAERAKVILCQLPPWRFDPSGLVNHKRTFRRLAFTATRLLANQGVQGATPLLARFQAPVLAMSAEQRWRDGFYLEQPEEWDDPYRFFRW